MTRPVETGDFVKAAVTVQNVTTKFSKAAVIAAAATNVPTPGSNGTVQVTVSAPTYTSATLQPATAAPNSSGVTSAGK